MSKLIIRNLANTYVEITDPAQTLLYNIQAAYIDWMHACGGKGRCTTCRITIIEGMQNISHPSAAEIKFRQMDKLTNQERLTCQCRASGDIIGEVPHACKLPHLSYIN